MSQLADVRDKLLEQVVLSDTPRSVLRSNDLKKLYSLIPTLETSERGAFGQQINALKQELEQAISKRELELSEVEQMPIDVTAPCGNFV